MWEGYGDLVGHHGSVTKAGGISHLLIDAEVLANFGKHSLGERHIVETRGPLASLAAFPTAIVAIGPIPIAFLRTQ